MAASRSRTPESARIGGLEGVVVGRTRARGSDDTSPVRAPNRTRLPSRKGFGSPPTEAENGSIFRHGKLLPRRVKTSAMRSWCCSPCAAASTAIGLYVVVMSWWRGHLGTGDPLGSSTNDNGYILENSSRNFTVEHDGIWYDVQDDGGPGLLWVAPDESPIPFSAFPKLNGQYGPNGHNLYESGNGTIATGDSQTTLLFLHVWKCAGSSLRHMLREYAALEKKKVAVAVRCEDVVADEESVLCLYAHQLVNPTIQGPFIRRHQVLVGHFTWGFQRYVRQPYVMFTTLRNPLELFVSGQQYIHRRKTKTLYKAVNYVGPVMENLVERIEERKNGTMTTRTARAMGKTVGFIYRLVEPQVLKTETLDEAATEAMRNLDTMWMVGVIEQYDGFMTLLRTMIDPDNRWKTMWESYKMGHYNVSPNGAGKVLGGLDPALVETFNASLEHQWRVYEHAIELFKYRCNELLDSEQHHFCHVKTAASSYSLTEVEYEMMHQQQHKKIVTFNASEIVRAKHLWADFRDEFPSEVHNSAAVLELFDHNGYDLTDEARTKELWKRLDVSDLFSKPQPSVTSKFEVQGQGNGSKVMAGTEILNIEGNVVIAQQGQRDEGYGEEKEIDKTERDESLDQATDEDDDGSRSYSNRSWASRSARTTSNNGAQKGGRN